MNNSVSTNEPKKEKDTLGTIVIFGVILVLLACLYFGLINPVSKNVSSVPTEKVATQVNK